MKCQPHYRVIKSHMSMYAFPERTMNDVKFFLTPSNADQVHETGPYESMITFMTLGLLAMYRSISNCDTLLKNVFVFTSVSSSFIPFITKYSFDGPTNEMIVFLFAIRVSDAKDGTFLYFFESSFSASCFLLQSTSSRISKSGKSVVSLMCMLISLRASKGKKAG